MKERMVPVQQLSDAGEDLARLAAAKDAEIALLKADLDAATATLDDEQAAHQDTLRLWQGAKAEIADLEQTVLHLQDGEVQTTLREMFPKLDAANAEIAALTADRDRWMADNKRLGRALANMNPALSEIAALTEQRDEAIAHSDNDRSRAKAYREGLRRLREQRDRAMKVVEAARDLLANEKGDWVLSDRLATALAALDAEAAAETDPSLPETPEAR